MSVFPQFEDIHQQETSLFHLMSKKEYRHVGKYLYIRSLSEY